MRIQQIEGSAFAILLITAIVYALTLGVAAADPTPLTFTVLNNGQESVDQLYVAAKDATSWGNNIITNGPIRPKDAPRFTLPDVCPCAVKAIYEDGFVRSMMIPATNIVVLTH